MIAGLGCGACVCAGLTAFLSKDERAFAQEEDIGRVSHHPLEIWPPISLQPLVS